MIFGIKEKATKLRGQGRSHVQLGTRRKGFALRSLSSRRGRWGDFDMRNRRNRPLRPLRGRRFTVVAIPQSGILPPANLLSSLRDGGEALGWRREALHAGDASSVPPGRGALRNAIPGTEVPGYFQSSPWDERQQQSCGDRDVPKCNLGTRGKRSFAGVKKRSQVQLGNEGAKL
jgi:hypothetical protein